jgi:hypothetical protein
MNTVGTLLLPGSCAKRNTPDYLCGDTRIKEAADAR